MIQPDKDRANGPRRTAVSPLLMGMALGSALAIVVWVLTTRGTDLTPNADSEPVSVPAAVERQPVPATESTRTNGLGAETADSNPERIVRSAPPPILRSVDEFDAEDKKRFEQVNFTLKRAGFSVIAETSCIAQSDMEAFRKIVDESGRRLNAASNQWMAVANIAIARVSKDLRARIDAGETSGLPVLGVSNPMQRRSPHEAISQLVYKGSTYVIRVAPGDEPGLEQAGLRVDEESRRRAQDFDTLVRGLCTGKGERR